MSIQANFPAIKPTLLLDFANTEALDPRITFTRASTGTYYDGKTVAKAEENLILQSQAFDNASWTKSGATTVANSTTAPDGTLTADTFVESSGGTFHYVFAPYLTYIPSGSSIAASCYIKANGRSLVQINIGNAQSVTFDLTSGTVSTQNNATGAITSAGSGWYRCVITAVTAGSGTSFQIYTGTGSSTFDYAGDGASGIYVWGAQVELRSTATAYTPTTTQPVTNYIPVLLTAASGVPRFEHNPVTGESLGLEIEEQRTNLFLRSEEFDNVLWSKSNVTVTANAVVSPDGSVTADTLVRGASTTTEATLRATTAQAVTTAYTLSVYVKAGTAGAYLYVRNLAVNSTLPNGLVVFNPATGLVVSVGSGYTAATMSSVGNGWYRCIVTGTTPASIANNLVDIGTCNASGVVTGNTGDSVQIWGAQLEAGAFPTSYIPTVASQVTRAADSAVMTGANFSSWYRQDEGTLFAKASGRNGYVFWARDSSAGLYGTNVTMTLLSNGTLKGEVRVNSVDQAFVNTTNTTTASTVYQAAFAYKRDDFAASLNAGVVATDTNGIVPSTINQVQIGGHTDGVYINGTISRITYYPVRVTNAQLQALTS